jgi:hypothetical protein
MCCDPSLIRVPLYFEFIVMNRLFKILTIGSLIIIFNILVNNTINAQVIPPPPPPNGGPNNGHGQGGNQPSGPDAPIGGGLEILIALGALYAGKKLSSHKKEK